MWDVSAAGHVASGGGSRVTAERELEEELGLTLGGKEGLTMEFLFRERSQNYGEAGKHGRFLDNEFQDVYVVEGKDLEVADLQLQDEEVAGVKYVHYKQYELGLKQQDPQFVPRPVEYQRRFFKWLGDHQAS